MAKRLSKSPSKPSTEEKPSRGASSPPRAGVSRSAKKQAVEVLQDELGGQLLALSIDEIYDINMSRELREVLLTHKRLGSFIAIKRSKERVGALLKHENITPIKEWLENKNALHKQKTQSQGEIGLIFDALCAGEESAATKLSQWLRNDEHQTLHQLLKNRQQPKDKKKLWIFLQSVFERRITETLTPPPLD